METERHSSARDIEKLHFVWPDSPTPDLCENFFFGAWHSQKNLGIKINDPPPGIRLSTARGRNWLLLSNSSPLHTDRRALVHGSTDTNQAVAFRGYIVDPCINSYSPAETLLSYWKNSLSRRHNGVFSAAVIDASENAVTLITDAFGFGPLYYRSWNNYLLFSTNPRFLAVEGDEPDVIAWRCWIQSGFIPSDRSLTRGVQRVPAGTAIQATRAGLSERPWFDFDALPDGKRSVDDSAFHDVEECFQTSISRCIGLSDAKPILPLSSGHDSRRILASLVHQEVEFESFTVRVQQKEFRDLDATFAAAMAADFDFPHSVVELADPAAFVADDTDRRILTDSESGWHTWVLSLIRALPAEPGIIFDGILGDILGNPGFRMPGMYASNDKDLETIVNKVVSDDYDSVLAAAHWPSAEDVRNEIRNYLQPFMHRFNMAEFAFILMRQRRNTALWSQQIMPAGHIVACPYLDLDYISKLLEFSPAEKHEAVFQRQCLQRFWPEFAKYPGNRDIPPSMSSGDPSQVMKRDLECFKQVCDEVISGDRLRETMRQLTFRRKLALRVSRWQKDATVRWSWGVHRLLELQAREANRHPCWRET